MARFSKIQHSATAHLQRNAAKRFKVKRDVLVDDKQEPWSVRESRRNNPNTDNELGRLRHVVEGNIQSEQDAKYILELLPDMNRVFDIVTSSIISPKDLTANHIEIGGHKMAPPGFYEAIREHFTTVYNFESEMAALIRDTLCISGSMLYVPFSVSTLTNFIRTNAHAMESGGDINKLVTGASWGILKKTETATCHDAGFTILDGTTIDLEAQCGYTLLEQRQWATDVKVQKLEKGIVVTDNPMILAKPKLAAISRHIKTAEILKSNFSLEGVSINGKVNKDLNPYLRTMEQMKIVNRIEASSTPIEDEVLNPIVMKYRHSVVIPAFTPGDVRRHIGYFIAIDQDGNPVHQVNTISYFKELNDKLSKMTDQPGNGVIRAGMSQTVLGGSESGMSYVKPLIRFYIDQLETELKESITKGVHGEDVEVSAPEPFYRLLLARQLKNQYTQLVYLPAELCTYFAFEYNEVGMGVSMLERTKLYASLRAILLFAELVNSVKNSVGIRKMNIRLDDLDPDKMGTVEMIMNEFVALQTNPLPAGKLNPSDIIDSLRRASIQVAVEGGEYFPGTDVNIEETNRQIYTGDDNLKELLRSMHYAGCNVTPDQVDASLEGDFATGITVRNLLQAKTVLMQQEIFTYHSSDFMRKYIYAGGPLYKKLYKLYDEAEKPEGFPTLEELIASLEMILPRPETARISAQMEEFNVYQTFVDTVLQSFITEESIEAFTKGEHVKGGVATIRDAYKNQLLRDYIRRENMLPELDQLFNIEEGSSGRLITEHNLKMFEAIVDMHVRTRVAEVAAEKRLAKLEEEIETRYGESLSGSDDESGDDDSFSSDDSPGDGGGFELDGESEDDAEARVAEDAALLGSSDEEDEEDETGTTPPPEEGEGDEGPSA